MAAAAKVIQKTSVSVFVITAIIVLCACGGLLFLALSYVPLDFSNGYSSKLYDKYVVKTLRKPFKRTLYIILWIIIGISMFMSLSPLPVVHFVYSMRDYKVWTKLMRIQLIRSIADGFYTYVMEKAIIKLIYTLIVLMILLATLPFTLAMQILANLDYMRVLAVLVYGPVLIMQGLRKAVGLTIAGDGEEQDTSSAAYKFVKATKNKDLLISSLISYAVVIVLAVTTYRSNPTLYDFCFHRFTPSAVAAMLLASGVFVHLAMVVYVEDQNAGRPARRGKAPVKDLAKKHKEMTIVSLCAIVVGAMFMRQWNAAYVERVALMNARFYALE